MNRRSLLKTALLASAASRLGWTNAARAQAQPAVSAPAQPPAKPWRHGTSLYGELKYPANFKQFDYVNAAAPKGGAARQIAYGTFDNFNQVIAGVKGTLAAGIDLIYDTLAVPSLDEVSSEYGLLAEALSYPDDFSSVTYRLRPEAKWHDGKPVTPDDVIFSFTSVQEAQPAGRRPITATSPRRRRPASAKSPSASTARATTNCRRSSAS